MPADDDLVDVLLALIPDGRYLGQVEFPEGFVAVTIGNDRVYGVWRDDLGVQYVMRLRIERGD